MIGILAHIRRWRLIHCDWDVDGRHFETDVSFPCFVCISINEAYNKQSRTINDILFLLCCATVHRNFLLSLQFDFCDSKTFIVRSPILILYWYLTMLPTTFIVKEPAISRVAMAIIVTQTTFSAARCRFTMPTKMATTAGRTSVRNCSLVFRTLFAHFSLPKWYISVKLDGKK